MNELCQLKCLVQFTKLNLARNLLHPLDFFFLSSFKLAQLFSFVDLHRYETVKEMNRHRKVKTKSNQNQNVKHTKFLLNAPLCTEEKKKTL